MKLSVLNEGQLGLRRYLMRYVAFAIAVLVSVVVGVCVLILRGVLHVLNL
ncbi:MAG: hypothetical protein L0387_34210 [Acidobacteria bacterium]|nr:hypothetical protein [Acidobacteriota bacterium]MCI0626650.1 hypothetical protein [Acidobacteriota bacterium]MCI0717776.1 hypothetical protein [Acidobacteriota bacterium]